MCSLTNHYRAQPVIQIGNQYYSCPKLGILKIVKTSNSRGQDVIPWDLLAEIDFIVSSYSLTLG